MVEGADRQMIENTLAVPTSRATGERVALDVRRHADLVGEVRDHGRSEVRFLIWKTTLRPPERQLTGEPQPTGIRIVGDERDIVGRQRPEFTQLVRRPQPLHARSLIHAETAF